MIKASVLQSTEAFYFVNLFSVTQHRFLLDCFIPASGNAEADQKRKDESRHQRGIRYKGDSKKKEPAIQENCKTIYT